MCEHEILAMLYFLGMLAGVAVLTYVVLRHDEKAWEQMSDQEKAIHSQSGGSCT